MNPFFLLFLLLGLVSCNSNTKSGNNDATSEKVELLQKKLISLKSYPKLSKKYIHEKRTKIKTFVKRNELLIDFNGSYLVTKNGQIIYEFYSGFSNNETKIKITKNTPLHLASISKVLTATAIFRLIEMNKLKLDDKVIELLPQFPYDTITIRMLLNHRSGIPNYAYFTSRKEIWNQSNTLRNTDIIHLLEKYKLPLDFEPNTKFVYNNSNYAILALIVENLTQMSFPKAMKLLVFEPLGMNKTFIFELETDSSRVSQSYKSTFQKVPFDFLDAIYGDKNCYSTPRDLLKYDLAMKNDSFISEKLKKEIFRGYSYEKAGIKNYGLGIRLKEWSANQVLFYHQGWWHGSTSSYVALKKENVVIIALSNKYSKKVYQSMRIAALFGDYPFDLEPRKKNVKESEGLTAE